MKIKNIKTKLLHSIPNSKRLIFSFLCVFVSFSASLSAQIFYNNDTKIFIGEETLIIQNFSQIQKTDSVHIYIVTGTTIIGLKPVQNITVNYLEKHEKTKTHLAEKHFKQEKKVPKHTPNSEKATPQKETFKQSDSQKTFFFSAHHSTAVAPTTAQNIKLIAFPPEEVKYTCHKATSQKLIFEKKNLLLLSVCLTTNNIRPPPPIVQKYR